MPYAGPFSLITGGLLGQDNPRDDIANWANEQQRRNRAAVGLDANGNPLPVAPAAADPNNPVNDGTSAATGQALASGVMPVNQQPNATKSDQSLGALLMNLTQYQMREQGFNKAMGMGFAAVSQPRDREMVSKMFDVNEPDVNQIGQTQMNLASQQQGQDRANSIAAMVNDPKQGPLIAAQLHMDWGMLKAGLVTDPGMVGKIAQALGTPTPQVATLTQLQIMQAAQAAVQKTAGSNQSDLDSLITLSKAGVAPDFAQKMVTDQINYRNKYGKDAPWKDNIGAYNQYIKDQGALADTVKTAQDGFQGNIDTAERLRGKISDLRNNAGLKAILEDTTPGPLNAHVLASAALADKDPDWINNTAYSALTQPEKLAISELKEINGQEFGNVMTNLSGAGRRPSTVEVTSVREGMGQTKNIFNFHSMKDYEAGAIDPMLTRIDEGEGDTYGAAQQLKNVPDRLKPFVGNIYHPGGNLNQEGSGSEDWYKNYNKPMPQASIDKAQAAIKANPANAFHVRDQYRRAGFNIAPLAHIPGVD